MGRGKRKNQAWLGQGQDRQRANTCLPPKPDTIAKKQRQALAAVTDVRLIVDPLGHVRYADAKPEQLAKFGIL